MNYSMWHFQIQCIMFALINQCVQYTCSFHSNCRPILRSALTCPAAIYWSPYEKYCTMAAFSVKQQFQYLKETVNAHAFMLICSIAQSSSLVHVMKQCFSCGRVMNCFRKIGTAQWRMKYMGKQIHGFQLCMCSGGWLSMCMSHKWM